MNKNLAIVRSHVARYHAFLGLLLMMLIQFCPEALWAGADNATVTATGGTSASITTIPVYTISAIPPITAWPGNPVVFKVTSEKLGAGATLTYTLNGLPLGAVTFDPASGLFSYTPDSADRRPFAITFIATLGSDTDAQTIQITPLPSLPPEQESFGLKPNPTKLPDPEDKSFIIRNDYYSEQEEPFNYENRKTRTVSVIGKRLVFQKGHPNGLYDYNGNNDIKEMRIYAETVVIRGTLHLPQTNVTIHARDLRFEDLTGGAEETKARLITTPRGLTTMPAQFANGADGLKGGDVTLHIQSYYAAPGSTARLVLMGGDGQPAGLGQDGNLGNNSPLCSDTPSPWPDNTTSAHWYTRYDCKCGLGFCIERCKRDHYCYWDKPWQPGNGGDATTPGRPGNGGAGGTIASTLRIDSSVINIDGGIAGAKAPDAKGGKGGTPSPAYRTDGDTVVETYISQNGLDAPAPNPLVPVGPSGNMDSLADGRDWLHPYALKMILMFAKDLYLHGDLDGTRSILTDYQNLIEAYQTSSEWAHVPLVGQLELEQSLGVMWNLLHRITANLDYFGNPAGWVPMLSFEVNKDAFEIETERAIRLWYLNYWLTNRAATLQQKVDAMASGRALLLAEIEEIKRSLNETTELIPSLSVDIDVITTETTQINRQLVELEKQLLDRAQEIVDDRYKKPFWKQALGLLGTICQVLPVGQPVVGKIGAGLCTISEIDTSQPVGDIISGLQTTYNPLGSVDFKKMQDDYKTNWGTLVGQVKALPGNINYSTLKECSGSLQKVSGQLGDALSKYSKTVEATQAPQDEVLQELAKIRASDPLFHELTGKVQDLLVKKEAFARKLQTAQQLVTTLGENVNHNILAVDALNRGIQEGNAVLDARAMAYLKEMERRSKERLLKYHYYMAKGYEYRLLEPYPGELDLDTIFNRFVAIAQAKIDTTEGGAAKVSSGQELTSEEILSLRALYTNQLSIIAERILDKFNASAPPQTTTITHDLTADDLKRLNNRQTVPVNLVERGRIVKAAENTRIVDLTIKKIFAHSVGGAVSDCDWAEFDIVMEHSGNSKLTTDGKIYQFNHYANTTANPITWTGTYNAKYGGLLMHGLDPYTEALIKSLVKDLSAGDQMLYSQPAVWSDINLSLPSDYINTQCKAGIDFVIDSMTLELTYSYTPKQTALTYVNIKPSDSTLKPLFTVSAADLNGRQDGYGDILRAYHQGTTIKVEAPAGYGLRKFVSWRDRNGNILGSDTSYSTSLSADKTIVANYVAPYLLTIASVSPASGVDMAVSPVDANGLGAGTTSFTRYYYPGTTVTLTAPVTTGGAPFVGWTGCAQTGGAQNEQCVVRIDGDTTVTATYLPLRQVTIGTDPAGLSVTVDGVTATTSRILSWPLGSSHTLSVTTPRTGPDKLWYTFANWSDGGAATHSVTASTTTGAYLAAFSLAVPTISGTPANSAPVGKPYSFIPTANFAARFSITNQPSWATFDSTTGALSGTPSNSGRFDDIVITAINGERSALLKFSITTLDQTPPALTVSTLSGGSSTNNPTLNVSGTATDPESNVTVAVIVNGTRQTVPLGVDGSFSTAVTLVSGVNSITVEAVSGGGTTSDDPRAITYNAAAPVATITTPADNIFTNVSPLIVSGSISETATVRCSVTGGTKQSATVTGANFTCSVNLTPGQNSINVDAVDLASHTGNAHRTITYDQTAPNCAITDPAQDLTTAEGCYTIKGTASHAVSPPVTVALTVDGVSYTPAVTDGAWSQKVCFTTDKQYAIVAACADQATNSAMARRNIIYDNQTIKPALNFGSVSGVKNSSIKIPVTLGNVTGVSLASVGSDISYDTTLFDTPTVTVGPAAVAAGKSAELRPDPNNPAKLSLLIASMNNTAIGNGVVAYVTFNVKAGAAPGASTIINKPSGADTDATEVTMTGTNGVVTVINKPGDCNGDGTVSVAEVQSAINMYLKIKPATVCIDLDGNGAVTVAEVQKVINAYLRLL